VVTAESEGLTLGISVEVRCKAKGCLRNTVSGVCVSWYQIMKFHTCNDVSQ